MSVVVPANEEGKKFYEQAKVMPAKWLMPDGSIVNEFPMAGGSGANLENNHEVSITENGEIEITPSEGKDGMKKVTANVAVPIPVLEENKATTIDVSAYTEPVEITPTQGKDGMAKATVTLTNIPTGNPNKLFAWGVQGVVYYTTTENPTTENKAISPDRDSISVNNIYEVTAEGIKLSKQGEVRPRYSDGDIQM